MNKILRNEGARPVRQPQHKLNPLMMEVFQEVQKLLDVGVIYPISDSEWMSPVYAVPKKTKITVVRNDKGDLVPKQIQNGWCMCIVYSKLNATTQKDDFPLPFIGLMLNTFAGKADFFLTVLLGIMYNV